MKAFVVTAISRVRHTHTCQVRFGVVADDALCGGDSQVRPTSRGEEPCRPRHTSKLRGFMSSKPDLA